MLKLEQLKKDVLISGLETGQVVHIVSADFLGESVSVIYKLADGTLRDCLLARADEANLSFAEAGRPWAFDADGAAFKLATEAYRMQLAHLFDPMMAVHTSNVEPLPHQITAVYESMLPRQPLRYVLADDPGAGKTIMAGLLIRELVMRADAKRVLIVAPGSLVEQWGEEMQEKFDLTFRLFSREQVEQSRSGNPFEEYDFLIARVDQLARADDLQEKLKLTRWDLVIVDEAHKFSASYFGKEVKRTRRFVLGELLGSITRNFLLMTATPHNGKEEDFQLFMSLLDAERFYGKFRAGAHRVEVSDLMRRMVKEDLLRFDRTRLFPERRAYTINYKLSAQEEDLYAAVTDYVKREFARADTLKDGGRKGNVGFALTTLQRRLASSPEAIYQSLKRRRANLQRRIEDEKLRQRGQILAETLERTPGYGDDTWEAVNDLTGDEYESYEETVLDQATAAQTIAEFEAEILLLTELEEQARNVVNSRQDRKWEELSRLLQDTPEMYDADGKQRKLIIFTEHRDTLNYLAQRIRTLIGSVEAVDVIHGGVKREDRRQIQEMFRSDPVLRVLLATDAAGEGVNLQNANLMINYDLPWNPNRLEQRFGRIHRIGQTEVCHLWNLVAADTREGDVFQRLFEKLETVRETLGGRVFDVLGEVFEEKSLKDFLIEAIRYGDDPEVRARLRQKVEGVLDVAHLRQILKRNALCEEVMDEQRLFAVREEMEKAEARKLQPLYIRAFFEQALKEYKGEMRAREAGRYEITNVPAEIRTRAQQRSGQERRDNNPVQRRYERICFEKNHVRLADRASAPMASLIHPGHALMQTLITMILEQHSPSLKQGTVMVDETDDGNLPKVVFILDHQIREGSDPKRQVSRRMQFIEIDANDQIRAAGAAPHLGLSPITAQDLALVQDVLQAPWISQGLEQKAMAYAATHLIPAHLQEVRSRRETSVDKTLGAVKERLNKEINYWSERYIQLKDEFAAGKGAQINVFNTNQIIEDLGARLKARERELEAQRRVVSATPVVLGGMLVIPIGLLRERQGIPHPDGTWCADAAARARVERLAMQTVLAAEQARGFETYDVSAQKCGWDITSLGKDADGRQTIVRHIEVKGRAKGQTTVTVTSNEVREAINQGEKFLLALVFVDGEECDGPHYVRAPFTREPDWAMASANYNVQDLLQRKETPCA